VWCRRYVSFHTFFYLFFFSFFLFNFLFLCSHVMGFPLSLTLCTSSADRRPIDPPPIVELRVIDKARKNLPSPSPSPPPQHHQQQPHPSNAHAHQPSAPLDTSMLTPAGFGAGPFLQNPYYFMFASLAKPDDDTELHWMKVRFWCTAHAFLLFTFFCYLGWKDAMYHRISRLVTLSPQGFGE